MGDMGVKAVDFPVCITFTPEGERERGLERPIDRVIWAENKNLERSPEEGDEVILCSGLKIPDGKNYDTTTPICAMKMPTGEQVVAILGLTTAIFENGKKAVIAIVDFIDAITGKDGKVQRTHKLMPVQIPEEMAGMLELGDSKENINMVA